MLPIRVFTLTLATLVCVVVLMACGDDDDDQATDGFPPEVAENQHQWPLPNHDYRNTRTAVEAAIDSTNVDTLNVAWAFDIPLGEAPFGVAASNPIIANDTVYFMDLSSNFYAFDLESGEQLWSQEYNNTIVGPNGPAIGYGKVFGLSDPQTLVALDAETGEEIWSRDLGHPTNIQPIVYDGMVYLGHVAGGSGGYEAGTSGYAIAVDQETGEEVWSFQTVEEGFWGNPDINSGAGIWFPPAVDVERDLVYYGTGNPAPFPGIVGYPNGESRPGDNLYSNSLLAFDHDTGDMEWYRQFWPHDIFDLDLHLSPVIVPAIDVRGEQRDMILASGKIARVFAVDAESEELIWDRFVGTHINDQLDALPLDTEVEVAPGTLGGIETPIAYDDGIVFTASLTLPTIHTATSYGAENGTEALQNADTENPENGTGEVTAIDASTGTRLWAELLPEAVFGGATVVNDLVFTATFDGVVYALDRDTGDKVWSYQAPAGINGQPAVAGETIIIPAGLGQTPQLIALRLGAETSETPTPSPTATSTATASPTPTTTGTATPTETASATATPAPTGGALDLTIVAEGIEFRIEEGGETIDEIRVPADATINLTFSNLDSLPHNFTVWETSDAQNEIFATETFTGPDETRTYEFTAPEEAGTYYFNCTVHPTQMTGDFVVE